MMPAELTDRRCASTKNNGDPCGVTPDLLIEDEQTPGTWWCFNHHPAYEEEREAARSRGGIRSALKARRHRYLDPSDLGDLDTPADAKRWSVVIARGLATGTLSSAAGQAALKAVEAFLRSLEAVDVSARLAALEQRQLEAEQQRARAARARKAAEPEYLRKDTTP